MVDNPLAGLQSFFFAGDKADPRVNQQLRQRIALAMMQRQSKFPKTLGEGLSAIGDAIGDRGLINSLLSGDLAQQDAAAKTATGILGGGPASVPQRTSYAPPADTGDTAPPPVTDAPVMPAGPAQAPPDLVNTPTPNQPVAALQPDSPLDGLAGSPEGQLATAPPATQASLMSPAPMVNNPVRNAIAAQLQQKPPPGMAGAAPVVPPVMAQGGDQRLAFNGPPPPLPPAITSGIQKAPPPPPPVQVAQNGSPDPGYVTPQQAPPQGAPNIPMSPEHLKIASAIAQAQARGDQYLPALLTPRLQALEAERTQRQTEANEVFKSKLTQYGEMNKLRETQLADQAKRIQEYQKSGESLIGGGAPGSPTGAQAVTPNGIDPRLGTPQSPQRTGVPVPPPLPPGRYTAKMG